MAAVLSWGADDVQVVVRTAGRAVAGGDREATPGIQSSAVARGAMRDKCGASRWTLDGHLYEPPTASRLLLATAFLVGPFQQRAARHLVSSGALSSVRPT